jgi:hypothetical protein
MFKSQFKKWEFVKYMTEARAKRLTNLVQTANDNSPTKMRLKRYWNRKKTTSEPIVEVSKDYPCGLDDIAVLRKDIGDVKETVVVDHAPHGQPSATLPDSVGVAQFNDRMKKWFDEQALTFASEGPTDAPPFCGIMLRKEAKFRIEVYNL